MHIADFDPIIHNVISPEESSIEPQVQQYVEEIERKPGTHEHDHHRHQEVGRLLSSVTLRLVDRLGSNLASSSGDTDS